MQYRPHRYPTQFPIEIRTPRGAQKGQVSDVNNDGAQLRGLTGLNRGDKVQLDVLSNKVDAIVQWITLDKIGITFRPLLSDNLVDTLRQRPNGRSGRRGSVGFTYAELR